MRRIFISTFILLSLVTMSGCSKADSTVDFVDVVQGIPVKNMVTLVDLGAQTCIPCKLMAPILDELKETYKGRAEIIFIDVWDKTNTGKAKAFKVMSIPTQIFYDKQGNEVFRHTGFFDKDSIVKKLEELLAV